jgi:hypothetical protein
VPLAMQEWYHEHQHYNLSAATCDPGQMCGHYTQVRGPEGGASRCWVGPRAGWAGLGTEGWGELFSARERSGPSCFRKAGLHSKPP